jgi:hypothetical protein
MTRLEQLLAEKAKRTGGGVTGAGKVDFGATAPAPATTAPAPAATASNNDRLAVLQREKERRATIADYTKPEDTVIPGVHTARGFQALDDAMRISASGMTGGWADTLAAGANTAVGKVGSALGISDPTTYADELAKEEAATRASRDRYNYRDPHSADVLETATSMITPMGVAGDIPKAWGWGKRAAALSGIGAGWGALSESGHGRDPITGALVGGLSSAAVPALGAAGGKLLPWATGGAAGAGTAWLGHALGMPEIGYAGTTMVTPAVKKGTEALMSKIPVEAWRNALAELSVAPVAAWGSRDTLRR